MQLPAIVRIAILFAAAGTAAAQGGPKPPPKQDVEWLPGEPRLVDFDPADAAVKIVPTWPVPPDPDGRFLYGPTPGYDVRFTGGLLLQPRTEDGSHADPILIRKPERRRMSFTYGIGEPVEVPIEFLQNRGKWVYRFPTLLEVRAGDVTLCLQDADGDGWFDDLEADRVAVGEAKDAVRLKFEVFTGEVTAGGKRYLVSANPRSAGLWPVSAGVRKDYVRHVAEVNAVRRFAGLAPAGLAEELIPLCEAHGNYCGKWGLTHFEDRNRAGYTPEGDWAGQHSNVGVSPDATASIRQLLQTLWHRNLYYTPALKRVGVGFGGGVVCSDVLTHSDAWSRKLVFAPINRALDVPLEGSGENPDPWPIQPRAGPFVTVLLPEGSKGSFKEGSVIPRGGQPLKFDMTDPENPPGKAKGRFPDNDACIVMILHQALKADTIYDVKAVVSGAAGEQMHTWSFRTRGLK
ncbi:MAG: hypothetical protein HYY18_07810 [Planctomycetes bacterium]|nr:hypothetical protein [Planctomycetota bacterium]